MNATTTLVGAVIGNGRYHVQRKLGEGGMALVYLAHDRNIGVEVVVKFPKPAILAADPEFARRFRHEIRSMVQLAHPHVVKINDVGEHDGLPYFVMEYLPGGSLEDRLGAPAGAVRTPLAPSSVAGWLVTVAAALDFVHSQGVVHRDIKPANILFDAHGNAFVSDFGIAKAVVGDAAFRKQTLVTQAGLVVGTGPYLAPEITLGDKYDGRADQYALAATVYEVVSGRVPFVGASLQAIVVQQTMGKVTPLHELVPTLPRALSGVVAKALDAEPRNRFADCTSFARAVVAAVAGSVAAVKPASPVAAAPLAVCHACGKSFRLPPTAAGKNLMCPRCGARHGVAQPVPVAPSAETRRTAAPDQATRSARREAAPRSSKMPWLMVAGVAAGVMALSCAGVLLIFGVGIFGFTGKRNHDPLPEPDQVAFKQHEPQPAPPPPPDPLPDPLPPVNPPPQPPVPPTQNPIPPAKVPAPATQKLGSGLFLVEAMTRVTDIAANAKKIKDYGYNDQISLLAAWLDKGKGATFTYPLDANTDYMFLGAGDKDARVIDLEVFDTVTNQRVAQDQTDHPEAIVPFRPQFTGTYRLKLTLIQSQNNVPCMCALVFLKHKGWSIGFKNLDDVTLALARRVSNLNTAAAGGKKYEFRRADNQWAVYGGAVNPGSELSVTNANLGYGDCVLLGGCDKCSNRLDLYLARNNNPITSYTGPATIDPIIAYNNCAGPGYGLRIRNSSTVPGASLVMMAVLDVK